MREAVKAWHAMAVATANLLVDPVAWRAALDEVNRRTATVRRLNDRYDVVKGRMRS